MQKMHNCCPTRRNISILLAAVCFAGCNAPAGNDDAQPQGGVKFTLNIKTPPELGDSVWLRSYNYVDSGRRSLVDSMLIVNCSASYVGETSADGDVRLFVAGGRLLVGIAEEGCINVDFDKSVCTGTPLNDAKNRLDSEVDSLMNWASVRYDSIMARNDLGNDDKQVEIANLKQSCTAQIIKYARTVIASNPRNALGRYAFWRCFALNKIIDGPTYLRELNDVDSYVADFPALMPFTCKFKCQQLTQVGARLTDVNLAGLNGESVKLSQLIGRSRVNLLHVFDPRDPRTVNDLAHLKYLCEQYGEQNLKVISICQFPDADVPHRIVDKFGLKWSFCADTCDLTSKMYGIENLPYFITLDGEGVITERDVNLNSLDSKRLE